MGQSRKACVKVTGLFSHTLSCSRSDGLLSSRAAYAASTRLEGRQRNERAMYGGYLLLQKGEKKPGKSLLLGRDRLLGLFCKLVLVLVAEVCGAVEAREQNLKSVPDMFEVGNKFPTWKATVARHAQLSARRAEGRKEKTLYM